MHSWTTLLITPDHPNENKIFAAGALILPDLRVTEDPMFASISSSAASWISMEQVKDVDVRDYLRRMKRDGYTVVGLEQTSTSQCLTRVELLRSGRVSMQNDTREKRISVWIIRSKTRPAPESFRSTIPLSVAIRWPSMDLLSLQSQAEGIGRRLT